MGTRQRQEENALSSPSRSLAWTAFLITLGVVASWFAFGGYVFGLGAVLLDPLLLLALGVSCVWVFSHERRRRGVGAAIRRLTCLAAFASALAFVLLRPFVVFGDTSDVRLVVIVSDQETGEPVKRMLVIATGGRGALSSSVTNERGLAMLEFKRWAWTRHSWLLSWRTFDPNSVAVEARGLSHFNSANTINYPAKYDLYVFNDSLGHLPKNMNIDIHLHAKRRKTKMAGKRGQEPFRP